MPVKFRDISIQHKLTIVVSSACFAALLIATVAFFFNDTLSFKLNKTRDLHVVSEIIGANLTAALSFDDRKAAEEVVRTLALKPHILCVGVYDKNDALFASYVRGHEAISPPSTPGPVGQKLGSRELSIISPIILDKQRLGTLFLRTDLKEVDERVRDNAIVSLIILLSSFLLALFFSSRFQRLVTQPILDLSAVVAAVSAQKDYSLRAKKFGKDELGKLTDSFNQMLDVIHSQNQILQKTNEQLETRVHERTKQLESANEELEAFSYSVSHDLRAPLRAIDGFGLALSEDYAAVLNAEGKGHLERIRKATQRMGQLIDDLLNLSRVTRVEMRREQVDLSGLVRSITDDLKKNQPERKVEFVIAPNMTVDGDERLLRIAFDNLLGNAWKFTAKHAHARIEFGTTRKDGQSVYFVRDDGSGFDMAYAGKLFGAFQRLHAAAEFPGTGVGLATVQRIIHRHGGKISAESALEKGTIFYFTL